jgi:2'-5' RNA ligase
MLYALLPEHRAIRPLRRERLHLTLRFYGELDGAAQHQALERVSMLGGESISVELAGWAGFPADSDARIVVARVGEDARLAHWYGLLSEPAASHSQGFVPHITLGRCRSAVDLRGWIDAAPAIKGLPILLQAPALYASEPEECGPCYRRVADLIGPAS